MGDPAPAQHMGTHSAAVLMRGVAHGRTPTASERREVDVTGRSLAEVRAYLDDLEVADARLERRGESTFLLVG